MTGFSRDKRVVISIEYTSTGWGTNYLYDWKESSILNCILFGRSNFPSRSNWYSFCYPRKSGLVVFASYPLCVIVRVKIEIKHVKATIIIVFIFIVIVVVDVFLSVRDECFHSLYRQIGIDFRVNADELSQFDSSIAGLLWPDRANKESIDCFVNTWYIWPIRLCNAAGNTAIKM